MGMKSTGRCTKEGITVTPTIRWTEQAEGEVAAHAQELRALWRALRKDAGDEWRDTCRLRARIAQVRAYAEAQAAEELPASPGTDESWVQPVHVHTALIAVPAWSIADPALHDRGGALEMAMAAEVVQSRESLKRALHLLSVVPDEVKDDYILAVVTRRWMGDVGDGAGVALDHATTRMLRAYSDACDACYDPDLLNFCTRVLTSWGMLSIVFDLFEPLKQALQADRDREQLWQRL